jgi:hypothetical protein
MQPLLGPDLEPEMERLMARLVPDFTSRVQGATPEEIDSLERIAGRPLPQFYRWFLWRMGRDMGPISYRSLDFSAKAVIAAYEGRAFTAMPPIQLIAYDTDPISLDHLAYDLDQPNRGDALIVDGDGAASFETLREMLVYGELLRASAAIHGQRVSAVLYDEDGDDVVAQLAPILSELGFSSPVETGARCVLQERDDAMLVGFVRVDRDRAFLSINVGARDQGDVRKLLGAITSASGLQIDIDEWDPPVP